MDDNCSRESYWSETYEVADLEEDIKEKQDKLSALKAQEGIEVE